MQYRTLLRHKEKTPIVNWPPSTVMGGGQLCENNRGEGAPRPADRSPWAWGLIPRAPPSDGDTPYEGSEGGGGIRGEKGVMTMDSRALRFPCP